MSLTTISNNFFEESQDIIDEHKEFYDDDDSSPQLYFRMTENGPELLRKVLQDRGWLEYDETTAPYWNLWWKGSRYTSKEYKECNTWQKLNHFPKSALITRKVTVQ